MIDVGAAFVIGLATGCVLFLLGFWNGSVAEMRAWQELLIERGHALYDPKTGKWRWKDEEPKP